MGGLHSGNRYNDPLGKDLVEGCPALDVRDLHRGRRLEPGGRYLWTWRHGDLEILSVGITALDDAVELAYPPGGEGGRRERHVVPLDWTACNFGGERPWFVCPRVTCGRRVAVLYGPGRYFLCRHCYDLRYESQREDKKDRALRRAQKISMRLGGSADMLEPFPQRPKGMHHDTYMRLFWEHHEAEMQHLAGMRERLDSMPEGLDNLQKRAG